MYHSPIAGYSVILFNRMTPVIDIIGCHMARSRIIEYQPTDMSMSKFLDWVNRGGKTYQKCSQHHSTCCGSKLNERENAPCTSIHFSLLFNYRGNLICCLQLSMIYTPYHDRRTSKHVPNAYVALVRCFVIAMRKVSHAIPSPHNQLIQSNYGLAIGERWRVMLSYCKSSY